MTLTDFLLARIAEDEAAAQVVQVPMPPGTNPDGSWVTVPGRPRTGDARVLAECEAKRGIVEQYVSSAQREVRGDAVAAAMYATYGEVLLDLASIYADHPDFREEWRV